MSGGSVTESGGDYHRGFTLSITKALADQLAAALAELTPAALTDEKLALLKPRPGVYQLYLDGAFVYVGKADSSLPDRLGQHMRKISGRRGISLDRLSFSCLYVEEDFSALAPEQLLINHHKGLGEIPWNNNGFGNKDPGRQRDHTVVKDNHFDGMYPIDLDLQVENAPVGESNIRDLLERAKAGLPYLIRYERKNTAALDELEGAAVTLNSPDITADELLTAVSAALPSRWQIVALKGYVIAYPDSPAAYDSALSYYRGGRKTTAGDYRG
ncbi:GIY-YIG nuclease family protein [Streptomyces sp. NPDC048251]|uniref:GIY-YIG nuclease family protein n=1 Tax=Streptomyces sp. NPDC048251 TaxID=3154501 RepID=UPI00341346A9